MKTNKLAPIHPGEILRRLFECFMVAGVVLLIPVYSHAQNLIANGSFESGATGWTFTGGLTIVGPPAQPAIGVDGTHCATIGGADIPNSTLSQVFAVSPGGNYLLSLATAAGGDGFAGRVGAVRVDVRASDNTLLASQQFTNTSPGPFEKHFISFSNPSNSTSATLVITDISPNGGIAVDPAIDNVVVVTQAQSWLTNGLIAHYPFNGNANDASGNGNNGIINGATLTTDRFNRANSAYYFDGNSWITMPQTRLLDGASNATISAWVVIKSGTSGEILAAGDGRYLLDPVHLLFAPQNADSMRFQNTTLGNVPNAFIGGNLSGQTLANFTADTWHQLVVVLSTNNPLGTLTIYVDGVINGIQIGNDNGTPFTKIAYDVDMPFLIGAITYFSGPGEFWTGKIDDIRIYNRALSSNEVAQLYAIESTTSPRTATGTATLTSSFVTGVSITDGGYGYTNTPLVRFIGGGGSGAQAVAVVSNGVVTSITVTNAGYGYTNAPLVVIEPPFIPNPVLGIAPMSFLSFSNLTVGGAYQMQQFAGWYWANQPVSFTATNAHYTQMVAGVVGSGDYRLALNPVPAQAFVTAQMANGFVVGATVTSGGSGYVTSPVVSIVGGHGTNATAVSHVSGGVVTSISITSAGIGYTNTPTVEIAPPPAAAVFPTVQPVMRLDSASLAPYDNYQIQFTPAITGTWVNWNGGLFTPTDVTNSQYLFITNGTGFFRLLYEP